MVVGKLRECLDGCGSAEYATGALCPPTGGESAGHPPALSPPAPLDSSDMMKAKTHRYILPRIMEGLILQNKNHSAEHKSILCNIQANSVPTRVLRCAGRAADFFCGAASAKICIRRAERRRRRKFWVYAGINRRRL